jgi:hypothetical protein
MTMTTGDPILGALSRIEERLTERIREEFRELRLDLDGRFDALYQRLDRLTLLDERVQENEGRLPAD